MAWLERDLDERVAKMLGPRAEVTKHAKLVEAKAKVLLAAHFLTGASDIERTRGTLDHFVSLVDEAAGAIEWGHFMKSGEYVEGLHIMTRAAGTPS